MQKSKKTQECKGCLEAKDKEVKLVSELAQAKADNTKLIKEINSLKATLELVKNSNSSPEVGNGVLLVPLVL